MADNCWYICFTISLDPCFSIHIYIKVSACQHGTPILTTAWGGMTWLNIPSLAGGRIFVCRVNILMSLLRFRSLCKLQLGLSAFLRRSRGFRSHNSCWLVSINFGFRSCDILRTLSLSFWGNGTGSNRSRDWCSSWFRHWWIANLTGWCQN